MAIPTILTQGVSTPATSTPITFTATGGRSVFVAAVAAAAITAPSPWVTVDYEVNDQGCGVWRLPPGNNPGGQQTVTLTHNGPRQCAYVVWEDDVDLTSPPVFVSGLTETGLGTVAGVFSPVTTTSGRELGIAVFGVNAPDAALTGFTPTQVNQSFALFGDSGAVVSATEDARLVLAVRENPALAGVTVVLDTANAVTRAATSGVLVYDQGAGGGGTTPTTTTLTFAPPSGAGTATEVTMTATISPAGAAGQVEFRDGTTLIATVPVTGGTAVRAHTFTAAGSRTVSATFFGSTGWAGSSDAETYVISGGSTQTDFNPPSGRRTIAEENSLTGAPSTEYTINGLGDPLNLGFVRDFSLQVGQTAQLAVDGDCTIIDVYRIGYYAGLGWRRAARLVNTPTNQPDATAIASSNGAIDCVGWTTTATWTIPAFSTPGLYVAVIRNAAGTNASWAPFVVTDPGRTASVVLKTSDTTWALAYNRYSDTGNRVQGGSFYTGPNAAQFNSGSRVHVASYNRPIVTRADTVQTYWTACEQPLIRFLERNGVDLTYVSCRELDAGALATIPGARTLISSGHDEYWSQAMRDNAEAFRDAGNNLLFLSANEVFWRIRFDAARRLVSCFKDTIPGPGAHVAGTPLDPVSWTGTWKDTRWAGRRPENTITGTDFRMNGVLDLNAQIDASVVGTHPFWRATTVAQGTDLTLVGVVGFEADSVLATQAQNRLAASTTLAINGRYADNNGENYDGNGDLAWGIVFQRWPSGALVAGFGTCQWAWALDSTHDRAGGAVSVAAQQATINLLRDLGATPSTLMAGLTAQPQVPTSSYATTAPQGAQLYVVVNGTLVPITALVVSTV